MYVLHVLSPSIGLPLSAGRQFIGPGFRSNYRAAVQTCTKQTKAGDFCPAEGLQGAGFEPSPGQFEPKTTQLSAEGSGCDPFWLVTSSLQIHLRSTFALFFANFIITYFTL
jgi:hypothetical protein